MSIVFYTKHNIFFFEYSQNLYKYKLNTSIIGVFVNFPTFFEIMLLTFKKRVNHTLHSANYCLQKRKPATVLQRVGGAISYLYISGEIEG